MIGGLDGSELAVLAVAAFIAGTVRGFSGFGTAMIYLPVAGSVLPPHAAITTLVVMDLVAPIPAIPRALRDADTRDLLRLGIGAACAIPVGVLVLVSVHPDVFRYAVSIIALVLLTCLLLGFRYRGRLTPPLMVGAGAAGGFLGGASGLPGPPVILLYMASQKAVASVRANNFLYLLIADLLLLPVYWFYGKLELHAILAGAVMIVPGTLGIAFGSRIFNPDKERVYRNVAFAIIASSALLGLPLWD